MSFLPPDVIMRRRRTVSKGYERTPAAFVATCATTNFATMDESLVRSAPLPVSYRPKYDPRYTMIPCTDTPKPWYSDIGPDFAATFVRQSTSPVNSRPLPEPTSAARRVRAKSSGYTMRRDPAPAMPPDAMFTPKNGQKSVFGLYVGNKSLIVSLNAKLNAWVGK